MHTHLRRHRLPGAPTSASICLAALVGCDALRLESKAPAAQGPSLESHTVYTGAVQHFDEHPPLVAGKPVKFAAHATDVRGDFKPIREGTITVVALRDGRTVAESPPTKASRPGIFGPFLTIPSPGKVEVRLRLEASDIHDEASLGEIAVYASEADAAQPRASDEKDALKPIAFLKEQQWRIEFRNEPAAPRSLVETLRVPARVIPRPGGRAIVAAPASGRLVAPANGFPAFGDRVESDSALGSLAPVLAGAEGSQFLAARTEIEARAIEVDTEIGRAQARLARAEKIRDRAERLRAIEANSERELDEARFAAELAATDLAAAEKLRAAFLEIRRKQESQGAALEVLLKSPMAGIVTQAQAVPGEYVPAGRILFEVVDLATVWLEGDVPEPDLPRLPPQPKASVLTTAIPGATASSGSLSFVALGSVIDAETRSARIVYSCTPPAGTLRFGAAVDILIETARAEKALAIPDSSVVDEDGRPIVFVQTEGEAFERRDVSLGIRSEGYVQVIAGVVEGERVVSKGAYAVRLQSVSTTIPAHGHTH